MNPQRIFGIVLTVVGMILLITGLNAKDSIADRFSSFFTGHFTDATTWYLLSGVVGTLVGISMIMFGTSKSKRMLR